MAKDKAGRTANEHGGRWGRLETLLYVGGVCTIVWAVWLGWKYDKFEAVWRLWQDSNAVPSAPLPERHGHDVVNITVLTSAVESGAVCLDGSPPAFFLDRGSGAGADNWMVFFEGGGWCSGAISCVQRSFTQLGSSKYMPQRSLFQGILSNSLSRNPDFYNWNRVLVKYCDGGSFNGDVDEPAVEVGHEKVRAPVFYRGRRIWKAVREELMELGMKNAENAFLSGCSAGGVAVFLHCDEFRDVMPETTTVKCMSDGGFFIDIPDVSGAHTIEVLYAKVVELHKMLGNLPKSCSLASEAKCFFPEYLLAGMQTPLFALNPGYDTWQFDNILVPRTADPEGVWDSCKNIFSACSESQLTVVEGFRETLLKRLQPLLDKEKDGAFIDSCYLHCQSQTDTDWNGVKGAKVDNKSIAQVVGDWYFGRNLTSVIDCPFPCNPSCPGYD